MQTWDFRIIDHGSHFGLHEVSYKRDGSIRDWSKRPIRIMARADEGPESIIALLSAALEDARKRQVLTASGDRVFCAASVDRISNTEPANSAAPPSAAGQRAA